MSPPGGQPPQKSYKEWNTGWNGTANENSWEITEAGIYTQAAYISLLVRVIANGTVALPLHVLSISANRSDNGAIITWDINSAEVSSQFEVERSFDRIHFISVQKTIAIPGINNYSINDNMEEVKNRTVYYRIHETDEQGRSYYSSIVPLPLSPGKKKLTLYPNPASTSITLYGYLDKKERMTLGIYNTEGKMVRLEYFQQPAGNYSRIMQIDDLASGLYSLQLSGNDGESQKIRFIKKQ
jgi:hypothetical protein